MGIYSYGYKAGKTPLGKKVVETVKNIFTKKSNVSPTIKSVKPNLTKTVDQTKSDEYLKRITELQGAEKQIKTGKKMIKEGQTRRTNMIDTKKAFQFKHGKSTHAIKPGEKPEVKYKGNVKEQKAKGGRVGLKFGGGANMGKKKSNVQKIKEAFGPKNVPSKFKGFSKLPEKVQKKINSKLAKKV
tara:strand:+ start:652 stop:1206 length:555 start_codon:yes stop_codon:yes gene_type:complete